MLAKRQDANRPSDYFKKNTLSHMEHCIQYTTNRTVSRKPSHHGFQIKPQHFLTNSVPVIGHTHERCAQKTF
jgi:hypothetical protein